MSGGELALWWAAAAAGLACSALFSGVETGIYTVNRVRLHLRDHQGQRSAQVLRHLLNRPTATLGTLLIGNNVANYMGSSALTVIVTAAGAGELQAIALNVALVTPLLFIFGETLPKDLFSAHADRLTYFFARPLLWLRRLCTVTGLLPLILLVSRGVSALLRMPASTQPFHPRRMVGSLVREAAGHGVLSDEQSAIVERVLALAGDRVRDEMVPWPAVVKVSVTDPPARLWELADTTSFSRFPALDGAGKVVGVVSLYDALLHLPEECPPIAELARPVPALGPGEPLRAALAKLQREHARLALVAERGQTLGIVTIKDLVEPITGELASW